MKNLVLFNGGESSEHEITLVSNAYIKKILNNLKDYKLHEVMIAKDGKWTLEGEECELDSKGLLKTNSKTLEIHIAFPYLHGHPGETGHMAALLENFKIPFFGAGFEAHSVCFNKVSTKLWFDSVGIPNSTYTFLSNYTEKYQQDKAKLFFKNHKDIFVKASHQGSSVGCYHITDQAKLDEAIINAFALSPYVLLEKTIKGRELEVSVYEFQGEIHCSYPGEIIVGGDFYSYEEKYSDESKTETPVKAKDLPSFVVDEVQLYAKRAFQELKLKDMARIDFFYSEKYGVILNEINTFPGMTPISMFPKMLEANGHKMQDFFTDRFNQLIAN